MSPQNVAGGLLDNDDIIEPSDLTIVVSPSASDKDVDTTVEETCERINLTASNVRNIIRVSVSSPLFCLCYCLMLSVACFHHSSLACCVAVLSVATGACLKKRLGTHIMLHDSQSN